MLSHVVRTRRFHALLALLAVFAVFSSVAAVASSPKLVKVADDYFSVKRLKIHKGTKVTWNWVGYLPHNVKVTRGPVKFHSPTQVRGTYSHVFRKKGTYHLYCSLHPNMIMTIIVK